MSPGKETGQPAGRAPRGEGKVALRLEVMRGDYAVCRLQPESLQPESLQPGPMPPWATTGEFWAATRSSSELSLVVEEHRVPEGVQCEGGWACLRVAGPLDFALTGILASITVPLAQASIPLFAISTFDTDYVLVKRRQLDEALAALRAGGHCIDAPTAFPN